MLFCVKDEIFKENYLKFIMFKIIFLIFIDYIRDAIKAKDLLNTKYWSFIGVLTRMSQGHLSRNEVVSLYSQARRFLLQNY